MKDIDSRLPLAGLTGTIIGAAMEVHGVLTPGLDERVYENALCVELAERGIGFDQQKRFPVHYRGRIVGTLVPDLVVENEVIVETKVVEDFCDAHVAQLTGYLAVSGLQIGLLLNFKHASLRFRRVSATRSQSPKSS